MGREEAGAWLKRTDDDMRISRGEREARKRDKSGNGPNPDIPALFLHLLEVVRSKICRAVTNMVTGGASCFPPSAKLEAD